MREYDDPNKDPNKYGSHAYWEVANRRLREHQEEEIANIERLRKEAMDRDRIAATFRQPSSASPSGSSQGSPLGLLILMGIVVAETWGSITNWAHGTWQTVSNAVVTHYPYKAAFLYYYYFFAYPLKGFGWVWSSLTTPGITKHSFLNIALALFGVFFYFGFLSYCLSLLGGVLKGLGLWHRRHLFWAGPIAICLSWFFVAGTYSFLFGSK